MIRVHETLDARPLEIPRTGLSVDENTVPIISPVVQNTAVYMCPCNEKDLFDLSIFGPSQAGRLFCRNDDDNDGGGDKTYVALEERIVKEEGMKGRVTRPLELRHGL